MTNRKFRIAILGIGGIGGYLGARLAARYAGSEEAEIIFIARGGNLAAIRENGVKLVTPEGEETARPDVATDSGDAGPVDVLVVCTKAYDLEDSVQRYGGLIGPETTILPLLNGVDHAEKIRRILPDADVWNGCVFIVARLAAPGTVRVDSAARLYQFGSFSGRNEKLERVEALWKAAGVHAEISDDIERTVWEKYIFISSLATLTSYLDTDIGTILASDEHLAMLQGLIGEVTSVAEAKSITLTPGIRELTVEKVRKAPPTATSSMHADFKRGGQTELETLTGYVVRSAATLGIAVPTYEMLYNDLAKR